ncbi:hypothetical protein B0J11DRAFT_525274 [Dendryphion nanum]|uniref:CENP-V/GFA domain-containing protein n=1 Tax=Dendryphion nanum TaxID=256645 RepID=A0A9P9IQ86_9PLEO|nr:hypothetical protein B0J11DRAFT_525274 [Dendryphion nanum]
MTTTGAYPGSCHCGIVQYQIRLTFPPVHDVNAESIRLYKCNCTTCHKMGFFHCRPINPGEDFILTAPSPSELGEYRCFDKRIGWYFCKNCGVRTFAMGGNWEEAELDVEKWAGKDSKAETMKVWKATAGESFKRVVDGKEIIKPLHYLSVNAVTLNGGEGGVDLREWHDKKWVFYVENLERKNGTLMRIDEPYPGGLY